MRYRVKSAAKVDTHVDIVRRNGDGYDIIITSVTERSVKEVRDYIADHLFEACLRTGHLIPEEEPAAHSA